MHVAIIMDGNGRWARTRGLPRTAGHRAGARSVREIIEAAAQMPIDILTLYAFSSDNWARPAIEVNALFHLLRRYLQSECARCVSNGVRVEFIGRRDRIPQSLATLITQTEQRTRAGETLQLRIALDYSSRHQILQAAQRSLAASGSVDTFGASLQSDVDLLIRTGGERRLSDFLLWEAAYAELVFVDAFWPDFDTAMLKSALEEFHRRDRRFGAIPEIKNESVGTLR